MEANLRGFRCFDTWSAEAVLAAAGCRYGTLETEASDGSHRRLEYCQNRIHQPSQSRRLSRQKSILMLLTGMLGFAVVVYAAARSRPRNGPTSNLRMTVAATSRAVASPRVVSISDFRPIAQQRLPRAVFDYLDGGADGEITLRENCRAFDDITFRPRHAVAFPQCDLKTRVLGFDLALPAMLAPVGYSRLMHPDGEIGASAAAGKAGPATSSRPSPATRWKR